MKSAFDLKIGLDKDELYQQSLSKSKERIKSMGEVFTPSEVVKYMCKESFGKLQTSNIINAKVLEPSCGEGQFITHIIATKWDSLFQQDLSIINAYVSLERVFNINYFIIMLYHAMSGIYAVDLQSDSVWKCRANAIRVLKEIWEYFNGDTMPLFVENEISAIFETNFIVANTLVDNIIYYIAKPSPSGWQCVAKYHTMDKGEGKWVEVEKFSFKSWSEICGNPKIFKENTKPQYTQGTLF